jgi:hypothetical protein
MRSAGLPGDDTQFDAFASQGQFHSMRRDEEEMSPDSGNGRSVSLRGQVRFCRDLFESQGQFHSMRDEEEMSPNSGNGRSVSLPRAGEILPLPVSPTGELGYSGVRGAVGLGYRFTVKPPLLLILTFYC